MNYEVKKYRKLLCRLQHFCSESKKTMCKNEIDNLNRAKPSYLTPDRFYKSKELTDFERGYIAGRHAAFNDVLKELHYMIEMAEYDLGRK